MQTIKELLEEEIQAEVGKLEDLEVGSKEYQIVVDGITKLTDKLIEIEKVEIDAKDKSEKRKAAEAQAELEADVKLRQVKVTEEQAAFDKDLKEKQLNDDRIDKIVKSAISIAGIVLPLVVGIAMTNKSLKFEETGTITTMAGRSWLSKLFPKI